MYNAKNYVENLPYVHRPTIHWVCDVATLVYSAFSRGGRDSLNLVLQYIEYLDITLQNVLDENFYTHHKRL
jgi:hypothetical protein